MSAVRQSQTFDEFYVANRGRLRAALLRLTRDGGAADEIAQDAFLALWSRWDRMGGILDLEGYLYRTARNLASRRWKAIRENEIEPSVGEDASLVELRLVILEALGALPLQQRRAVLLVLQLGFRPAEAARMLRIEPSTLRVHVARARRELRRSLAS